MDVYYHVKFQPCITSGSKVSRGVQNCTPLPGIGCVQTPPGIGLRGLDFGKFPKREILLPKKGELIIKVGTRDFKC